MPSRHEARDAFTLVELLAVLAVIAVLVGILMPVLGGVRSRQDRVVALSQMHQIAVALAAYPGDHNGTFPGPLFPGQLAMCDPARGGRLTVILAPYLGITLPTTPRLVPLFIPPAYQRAVTADFLATARTYVMNMAVPMGGGVSLNPWGNATTSAGGQPLAVALIPGQAWAFSDADQLHPRVIGTPWQANTPAAIIHGTRRLAVRFDGSAGDIDAADLALPTTP